MENRENRLKIKYRKATEADSAELALLFWGHIACNREYISHGELQMGVASRIYGELEPDGKSKWTEYVLNQIRGDQSMVIVAEYETVIVGFVVLEIMEDGDKPFGVINDLLVREDLRGCGIGVTLLDKGLEWFEYRSIEDYYLESGKDNEFAHIFFINRGFRVLSYTFKKLT